jgi:protease I
VPTPQREICVVGSEFAYVRVAFLVANDGIEEAELVQPWHSMVDAGARAELVAIEAGLAQTVRHLTPVTRFPVDRTAEEAQVGDFDGVVLPGGVINADRLRGDAAAVDFLVAIVESGKPVGALCHGLCPLIDGDLVCGRTVTSAPGTAVVPPCRHPLANPPFGTCLRFATPGSRETGFLKIDIRAEPSTATGITGT